MLAIALLSSGVGVVFAASRDGAIEYGGLTVTEKLANADSSRFVIYDDNPTRIYWRRANSAVFSKTEANFWADKKLRNFYASGEFVGSNNEYEKFYNGTGNKRFYLQVKVTGERRIQTFVDTSCGDGNRTAFCTVPVDEKPFSPTGRTSPPADFKVKVNLSIEPRPDGPTPNKKPWGETRFDYDIKAYPSKAEGVKEANPFAEVGRNTQFHPVKETDTRYRNADPSPVIVGARYTPDDVPIGQSKFSIVAFTIVQSDGSISDTAGQLDKTTFWEGGLIGVLKEKIKGIDADLYVGTCQVPIGTTFKGHEDEEIGDSENPLVCNMVMKYESSLDTGSPIDQAISGILGKLQDMTADVIDKAQGMVSAAGVIDQGSLSRNEGLQAAWTTSRNIANIFFLIILLVIAFTNVSRIGIEYYTMRSLLPKFVAAVVLVNLSFFIAQITLDAANVLTQGFSSIQGPEKVFAAAKDFSSATGLLAVGAWVLVMIFALLAGVLLWALMVVRILVLWMLIIFAPLAFLANVLPATQSFARGWWSQFIKFALIAPAVALILQLGEVFTDAGTNLDDNGDLLLAPMFGAMTLMLAAMVPIFLGGKIMATASGYVKGAMGRVGNSAYQRSGLAAARATLADRRELRQGRRGALLTDTMGSTTRGRLGTVGERQRFDAATRGKMSKDVAAMSSPQLERLARQGNRWERDEALNALVARDGIDDGVNRLQAAGMSRGRYSHAGMATAIDTFASSNPDALDRSPVRGLVRDLRGHGYMGPPKYSSAHDYTARMQPEDYAKLGAGAVGRLSPRALEAMNLNERTLSYMRGSHINSILDPSRQQQVLGDAQNLRSNIISQYQSGTLSYDQAQEQLLNMPDQLAHTASGYSLASGRDAFHRLNPESQRAFLRHVLDKAQFPQPVLPMPSPGQGGAPGVTPTFTPSPSGSSTLRGRTRVVPRPTAPPPPPTPQPPFNPISTEDQDMVRASRAAAETTPVPPAPIPGGKARSGGSSRPTAPGPGIPPEDFQAGGRYAPPPVPPAAPEAARVTSTTGESTPAAPAPAASAQASDTAQAANAPGFSTPAAPPAPAPAATPAATTLSPESRQAASRIAGTARAGGQRFIDARPQMEAALSGRPDWEQLSSTGRLRELQRIWRGGK